MDRGSVREPRRPLVSWNDEGSLAAVRPDYRNGSGAGVSTDNSSDLLVANTRAVLTPSRESQPVAPPHTANRRPVWVLPIVRNPSPPGDSNPQPLDYKSSALP